VDCKSYQPNEHHSILGVSKRGGKEQKRRGIPQPHRRGATGKTWVKESTGEKKNDEEGPRGCL